MAVETKRKLEQKWIGAPVPRKEDGRFLMGQGNYVDDIELPGMAYAALVRSPYPHARIVRINTGRALSVPGVLAVITGAEVAQEIDPFTNLLMAPYDQIEDYGIAVEKARYVGEPVAIVVAEDKYAAEEGLDFVDVEYERLQPVLSGEDGLREGAVLVHENVPSNLMWHRKFSYGNVEAAFAKADLVVRERLHFHRFTSAPLEPNAVIASYEPGRGSFTIWSNNQRPAFNQHYIAHALRIPTTRFRYITPDIGGGFGIKNDSYPYIVLTAIAARKILRPVKWLETRQEHLLASTHGQDVVYEGEMALQKDGRILGLRARAVHDDGAYMRREPVGAFNFIRHATSTYSFADLEMEICAVATNKCPVGPNRSYGKMQQCYLIERLLDIGAHKLGVDPIDARLRNFVLPQEQPYETPTGAILDGGDYPQALLKAAGNAFYEEARADQERQREEGRLVGIGVAMGMDGCPINFASNRIMNPAARVSGDSEATWVKIDEDGNVLAAIGTSPQGHGHETVVAQIVADRLGLEPGDVDVLPGFDSATHLATPHSGTYASRFAIAGAASVLGAANKVRHRVLSIAAHLLDVPVEDLDLAGGRVVAADGTDLMGLVEVAHVAWRDLARLPEGDEAGIFEHCIYSTPFGLPTDEQRGNFSLTYSYAACVTVVEVDSETGMVQVRELSLVEDCGNKINPMIVEGQIHGQIAHQLGAALYEHLAYDAEGQLLTASFKDYLAPTAADFPSFTVDSITTPSPFTPLGTRGTGEGGGAPLISAVSAVADALAPLGITITDSYLDPTVLLQKIQEARGAPTEVAGNARA
jgi:2-furoyl-CoA dehydrogenase large subunit